MISGRCCSATRRDSLNDVTTVDRIAGSFPQPLPPTARSRIFASSRREAIETFIAEKLPQQRLLVHKTWGDIWDPVTLWHAHHAGRTGEIGRWRRMLSSAQVAEVERRRLGNWMDHFSYQRHDAEANAQ